MVIDMMEAITDGEANALGGAAAGEVRLGDGLAGLAGLAAGSVDAVVTDPPYNLLENHKWDCAIDADRLFAAARRALKPTGGMVLFGRGLTLYEWVLKACRGYGFTFKEKVVWCKPKGISPFLPLNRSHELAVVLGREEFRTRRVMVDSVESARHDAAKLESRMEEMHRLAREDGRLEVLARLADAARAAAAQGRNLSFGEKVAVAGVQLNIRKHGFSIINKKTIEDILPRCISRCGHLAYGAHMTSVLTVDKQFEKHFAPTAKPVYLLRCLARACSDPGGLIVDPFAGGGSTVVAAVKEGRRGLGFELNPMQRAVAAGRVANAVAGRCECGEVGQRRTCPACLAVARTVFGEDLARRVEIKEFDAAAALKSANGKKV